MTRKKILALICAITLTTTITACGATTETATTNTTTGSVTTQKKQNTNTAGSSTKESPTENFLPTQNTTAEESEGFAFDFSMAESETCDMAVSSSKLASNNNSFEIAPEESMPEFNTEEYNYIKENSFLKVSTSPLSTFAADVDTGSYTNLRRMLRDNYTLEQIPQGSVRTEEMINYFDYDIVDADDDNRFTVNYETNICPWNEDNLLLMLSVKAKDVDLDYVGNNFVFLIDSSGSMAYDQNKGTLAIKSFKLLAETLTENDRVSIVTYSGSSAVILDSCPGNDYKKICKALDSITFGGGTNGSGGITAAYELAGENFIENGNNRVIIASDGDMNLGITSTGGLTDLIREKKESGVFLTVLGYGSGNYSDANMESIADCGNGNYYYIDCIDEANRVLVDKLKQTTVTVAKDVKLQVEFNPLEVSEYRLLGYENRTMAAEDFEDDTKDGGETGAGQTVTVLYELVCNSNESDAGLKYQTDREVTDNALTGELLTLSIRYKEPDADKSVEENHIVKANDSFDEPMSSDFAFVAGLAELSMLLNDSDYAGDATLDTAYELVKHGSADNKYREELVDMIQSLRY